MSGSRHSAGNKLIANIGKKGNAKAICSYYGYVI